MDFDTANAGIMLREGVEEEGRMLFGQARVSPQFSTTTGGAAPAFGLITFSEVLEYRWVADFAEYEEHAAHEEDFEFGLIEILDSAYVENMAAKGAWREYAGHRFGHVI